MPEGGLRKAPDCAPLPPLDAPRMCPPLPINIDRAGACAILCVHLMCAADPPVDAIGESLSLHGARGLPSRVHPQSG